MKKMIKSLGLIALGAVIAVNSTPILTSNAATENQEIQEYVVLMQDAESTQDLMNEHDSQVVQDEETVILNDGQACTLQMTEREARHLEKEEDVLFVEENILFEAEGNEEAIDTMNSERIEMELEEDPGLADTDFETLPVSADWNRDFIHANADEVGQYKGQGINIAVLDSGLVFGSIYESKDRIDLVGNEMEDNLQLHEDLSGHGTAINTVIAVNSPEADVYSIRILDGSNRATLSKVIAGVQWAIDNHMDIINMSFGASVSSEILHQKIREAYDAGILIVAAAGNTGETTKKVSYPAAYDEVVSVGSCDTEGRLSEFSAEGSEILAPGEGIITESLFGGSMSIEGTSIAAPHVTAAAALIWSSDDDMTSDQVRRLLDASANKTVAEPGIVDAGMAYQNKEQFLTEYQPGELEYTVLEGDRTEVEDNAADLIVSGCWSKKNHMTQAKSVEAIFDSLPKDNKFAADFKYIKLMAYTAYYADEYYGISYDTRYIRQHFSPLHAFGYTDYPNISTKNPRSTTNNGGMNNNYVADLKYMYRLARHYYDAESLAEATSTISDVTIAKANYKILRDVVNKSSAFKIYDKNKDKEVTQVASNGDKVKGIIYMNIYDWTKQGDSDNNKLDADDGSQEAAAWKILGLAAHMAGDTYAHRTRVPKSAATKGSGNVFDEDNEKMDAMYYDQSHSPENNQCTMAQFLKEENTYATKTSAQNATCCCKDCVIQAVRDGRMEFRDIPYVIKNPNEKKDGQAQSPEDIFLNFMNKYDDKIEDQDGIHVYAQRYQVASNYAVNRMVAQFLADKDFSIHFFLPQKYNDDIDGESYTLKLNGLKHFIIQTGTQWDKFKQTTKDMIEKYSTGTETYF